MKKAFSMIELVFVIVVIGILATVIIPRTQNNKLQEAATQVLSHIRYVQHLAIVNDRYNFSDSEWFKQRWHLVFGKSEYTNDKYAYSIFSDSGAYDGNPNLSELAIDPSNQKKYLSGGDSGILYTDDSQGRSNKNMNIGESYGVDNIKLSGGCRSNVYHLYFDHLGRPFNSMNPYEAYEKASPGWHRIVTENCNISLCDGVCTGNVSDNEVIISIHPQTGYACVLNSSGVCRAE